MSTATAQDELREAEDDEPYCAAPRCHSPTAVESETDEEGVFWTLCRCGFWTEHLGED